MRSSVATRDNYYRAKFEFLMRAFGGVPVESAHWAYFGACVSFGWKKRVSIQ